ncbi:hypothetical protein A2707_06035 [Candidatus Saccharibacteria bacterium RIFCSPHIGHO2_01_FULL_45_15]|nr:MAG: hypothetical protein A2707_06035 [Candidatus Saccharibacteria bacterium RIFCSPHIGHO2_01_FULL_45_15]OGL27569.1 MAG: hypothetical protein A3C39_04700 [Candidatus Saccharibacteria bacterium RIFCSPHIGHO2_02_FULL_46_12]OGL32019.1 MAG: hypothetical protein A3E76_01980 [Candidatus Saccharibacteria bacterium RIFCSPHIGHO2_12_FULL_44_22]
MKRLILGLIVTLGVLSGLAAPVSADANDFTFKSFEADYYLGSDSEGRSTLKTVEKLTAEFNIPNQNHGIERAIPKNYDGHPTTLKIQSVTDENNTPIEYEVNSSNGNSVLRIGDGDTYVTGTKTYVITYTQRDVTKYFENTGLTEFYWDTNGTLWNQPFGSVMTRVHLSDSVLPTLTDKLACYYGSAGATNQCSINAEGSVITATADSLQTRENMTIAVGFTAGTFRGYEQSTAEKIGAFLLGLWLVSLIITVPLGIALTIWFCVRYVQVGRRSKEMGTIVAEYLPPKQTSVLAAAKIGDGTRAETIAQMIDLAVRHYIKIYQTKEKSTWKPAEFELEITKDISDLTLDERDFIATLFGATAVGTKLDMKTLKNNYKLVSAMQANSKRMTKRIQGEYGLQHKDETMNKWFMRFAWILLLLSIVFLAPTLFIAALTAFICGSSLQVLTDKGLNLRRYLAGLKLYIGVAEQDRVKMLQSPEGAEKIGSPVDGNDSRQMVKLYEKVLPYAVLFGQEKEWNKQLGSYYEQASAQPDWYVGQTAFNAALFTTVVSDFGASMNSYSASSDSSSGGSSGGGSSGGGGGGGGGGGW